MKFLVYVSRIFNSDTFDSNKLEPSSILVLSTAVSILGVMSIKIQNRVKILLSTTTTTATSIYSVLALQYGFYGL